MRTFTCVQCGNSYIEEIPIDSSNHVNTTNIAATASTCTEHGYTAGVYCNDCKQYISGHQEQPLAAHTPTTVNQTPATCGEDGYTGDTVCSACGAGLAAGEIISKETVDHTWDDGVVTLEPTEEAPGVRTYTCTVCSATRTEEIPQLTPAVQPGDINGDGVLNSKDLTRLMKYLAGEDVAVEVSVLDVNGDGVVNNKDLTRLMKYLAGEDVQIF